MINGKTMNQRKYAHGTTVSIGRTRDEIESILNRFGADQFAWGRDDTRHATIVQFRREGRGYRFTVFAPDPEEFRFTPTNRRRDERQIQELAEKEYPRRFRSLANYIKAILDAVDSGLLEVDAALLPFAMLPSGLTVAEQAIPQLIKHGTIDLNRSLPAPE